MSRLWFTNLPQRNSGWEMVVTPYEFELEETVPTMRSRENILSDRTLGIKYPLYTHKV